MILNSIKKILKSKKAKRILLVFIFLFICYFAFSVGADCFADGTEGDTLTKITNFNTIASEVIKCMYVLLWPLIFVCGIALDNSLVYGTWLHLDAPLWTFWNIMKNIANFMLGGLVLFSVLKNLLSVVGKSGDNKWSPLNIIKNTLIAGILIQMSRFLVAAVIDVSTVLTYSVGGLPMTVLKVNPHYSNRPIMSLSVVAGSDVKGMKTEIYYTYGDHKISDCIVSDKLPVSGSYILGPKIAYLWDSHNNTGFYMDTGYCALGGWPYRYNHILSGNDGGIYYDTHELETVTGALRNETYLNFNKEYRPKTSGDFEVAFNNCAIVPVDDSKLPQTCAENGYGSLSFSGDDIFFTGQSADGGLLYTVDNLIEQSKGFVGPLITIYSSLLDIQSFVDARTQSPVETFISLLFKFVFFVILVAPLIGLTIVLIVRIGILWVVIAAAPVLILVWVFGDALKGLKDILEKAGFGLGNVIKLIFAPVIITGAISLSLVFINAISMTRGDKVQREEVFDALGIQADPDNDNKYSILGLVDIELDTKLIGEGKDDFAYFITLLFSSAIIWFFLIAALKMCGGIGEKVGKFIGDNFEDMMGNAPIIPIKGGSVGWNQLKKAPDKLSSNVITQFRNQSEANMKESFGWLYNLDQKEQVTNLVTRIKTENLKTLSAAEVAILQPVFGTNDEKQLIEMATNIESKDLNNLVESRQTYSSPSNQATVAKIAELGTKIPTTHTTADALQLTATELNMAVQNDDAWIRWAEGMVGGAVHTVDGVRIVDVIPGTEANPIYRIVDRNEYEETHFGKPVEKLNAADFEKYKNSTDEKEQKMARDMEIYLTKMADSDKKFEELKRENEAQQFNENSDKAIQLQQLENMFNDAYLKILKELDGNSNRFTVPEQQQGQQS